jgi:lipoprotein-releasing system permease protein
MNFSLLIARSHLRGRRDDAGVGVLASISIMGVAVGVTALLMVLAVMEGFEIDLRNKILGSNAHVVVLNHGGWFGEYGQRADEVAQVEGVVSAAPFIYSEVMIRSTFGAAGVILKGIDPQRSPGVTDIAANLTVGPTGSITERVDQVAVLESLSNPPRAVAQDDSDTEALPGIIIGSELADLLKLYPGDRCHVINPIGGGTGPFGVPVPKVQPFRIAGIFYSGMYEYDTKWTYVAIPDAQTFLQSGPMASGIEAKVTDIDAVGSLSKEVEAKLGYPFYTRHWKTMNKPLFAALKLEKYVMGLILGLIVLVASLNIVGSLILIVLTRAREIAILRAMGATIAQIRLVFMLEGLLVGVVGTTIGTVLGLAGCTILQTYPFPLDTDVYYVDKLPCIVVPETVAFVAVCAVLICFLATLYPSRVAARVDPIEGLRYE